MKKLPKTKIDLSKKHKKYPFQIPLRPSLMKKDNYGTIWTKIFGLTSDNYFFALYFSINFFIYFKESINQLMK